MTLLRGNSIINQGEKLRLKELRTSLEYNIAPVAASSAICSRFLHVNALFLAALQEGILFTYKIKQDDQFLSNVRKGI